MRQIVIETMLEFTRINDVYISTKETCRLLGISSSKLQDINKLTYTRLTMRKAGNGGKTSGNEYLHSSVIEERNRIYRRN